MKQTILLLLIFTFPWTSKAQLISLRSDNQYIEDAFGWAVDKAGSWRMTGQSGEINRHEGGEGQGYKVDTKYEPSYWAGYAHRTAYYIRDFAHQASGAHLVGMDEENYAMLQNFADNCTEDKLWFSWWALNFDGSVFTLDAPNPPGTDIYEGYPAGFVNKEGESFVREIPAMFELVEKAWKCYLWTGDKRYVQDENLWQMYQQVVTEFVALHDSDNNGIPEGVGNIFAGSATYNEADIHPFEAGDAIGSQFQAYLAFAAFLAERNQMQESKEQFKRAEALRDYFNKEWSALDATDTYSCAITNQQEKFPYFNKETSWFMPMKLITEPGKKNDRYLDFISMEIGDGRGSANQKKGAPHNIEAYTYLPDTYFPYNRVSEAWKWMKYIIDSKDQPHVVTQQGTNGNYPEVSFTLVSQVVEGLMGVEPNAAESALSTIPRLPGDIDFLELDNLKIGAHAVKLHHTSSSSRLTHSAGNKPVEWTARFYGKHAQIVVNGKKEKSKTAILNGVLYSYAVVQVGVGETVEVKLE